MTKLAEIIDENFRYLGYEYLWRCPVQRPNFDSVPQAIDMLVRALGRNQTYLAALLGISERTLSEWRSRGVGELPPKALRLVRLKDAVDYLLNQKKIAATELVDVLNNGRVPISPPIDEDNDSMALVAYLTAFPEERAWMPAVDAALEDYRAYRRSRGARAHAQA